MGVSIGRFPCDFRHLPDAVFPRNPAFEYDQESCGLKAEGREIRAVPYPNFMDFMDSMDSMDLIAYRTSIKSILSIKSMASMVDC